MQNKTKRSQFVYGTHPVIEALNSGRPIEKIFVQKSVASRQLPEIRKLAKLHEIPLQVVPVEKLNRMVNANHQGVVAIVSPIIYQNIENVLPMVYERGEVPLILVLDRLTDVRNFGAIARSAECAGVHAIVVPARGSAMITADAVKTSAGALNKIPVCRSMNLKESLVFLADSGLKILACTEKGSKAYYDEDLSLPIALIMGSEEDGVSGEYLKLSQQDLYIPMIGEIASLNVSVATAVILFETRRQRDLKTV